MKQQRLFKLSVVFLIPLVLLALLLISADRANPAAAANNNATEFLPDAPADAPSLAARRMISIPLTTLSPVQVVARRAISIPYIVDNTALTAWSGSEIAAMRAISIPYIVDNAAHTPLG